jgi:hypothetical protein
VKKFLLSGLFIILLLVFPASSFVSAASTPYSQILSNSILNGVYDRTLRPSDIEIMYPMSSVGEAALVHVVPQCPVNVDGTWFKAEEIVLFNGHRLHFTVDKTGALFAFTNAKAMESFLETEYGPVFDKVSTESLGPLLIDESEMFEDWMRSGLYLPVQPHELMPDLVLKGWNDRISSTSVGTSAPVTLWENIYYGGDSFTMLPGSIHNVLTFEGWNDRASSIS